MSKKHREKVGRASGAARLNLNDAADASANRFVWFARARERWWLVGLVALLALGTFGAGLQYLETDARRELAERNAAAPASENKENLLNRVNPFLPAPTPAPTLQLSKEYVYAGSRLLSVVDANAAETPPADLAVWRPSTGYWYVLGGINSQQTYFQWGGAGDTPMAGDFDGDGKTDFSVWRPSAADNTATWYVSNSSSGSYYGYTFGLPSDVPTAADFDGDGKTDIAVFRPSTGYWYIQGSAQGFFEIYFGTTGDSPAPADFDGDGRADAALWRASGYTFYTKRTSDNQTASQAFYGALSPTDKPVNADYDGDGRADFAVRHGNDWLIRYSATAYANAADVSTVAWQAGTHAVPNDYDGDGKVDVAVWNAADGYWKIRQSTKIGQANELRQAAWGQAGDIPVPAFYRR